MVAVDVAERLLAEAVSGLSTLGEVHGMPVDITSEEEVRAPIREVHGRFGRLDVPINNAGIAKSVPFLELSSLSWDQTLAVNLRGPFVACQEACASWCQGVAARS